MDPSTKSTASLVAFLFTDIEGSSVRWLNHRAAMEKAVARHDAIVRRIVSECGGKIFKAAGDAFYISFSKPADAANAAIALQRAFLTEDFAEVEGLRVRMAVHFGSAEKRGKDFFGPALNRTARLLDLAHGGQILVTASTAEIIKAEREVDASFIKVGTSPLDDPAQPVDVQQMVAQELPREFPKLRPPKNLSALQPVALGSDSKRWMIALAIVSVLVAAAALLRSRSVAPPASPPVAALPTIPEKSVAVLPFDNLSEEKENAFFANGMQDEILTDLARVADLKVISRSSVMHYKTGVERNLREIGKALGVAYVLEGSVQRAGGKVRVTAQLIDTRSDAHVWAQRYDRDLADIFAIQSEVAEAIAAQLRAKISPAEKAAMVLPPTRDLAAYDLYQRALLLTYGPSGADPQNENLQEAARLLDAAVARDPGFRLAYVQLALTHDWIYWNNYDHSEKRLALAEAAVQAAERLDPKAGETLAARAVHSYWGRYDLTAARRELELAAHAMPNDATVLNFLGLIDRREGRWDESIRNLRHSVELDPQNRSFRHNLFSTYRALRRYREAIATLKGEANVPIEKQRLRIAYVEAEATGNLKTVRSAIDAVEAVGLGAARDVSRASFETARMERDATKAAIAFDLIPKTLRIDSEGFPEPHAWFTGNLALMRGDKDGANKAFFQARQEVVEVLQTQGETAAVLGRLAQIDAYLGRRDDALREAKRACELLPMSTDKIDGPLHVGDLALVYAVLGDKERALEELAKVVGIPSGIPYVVMMHEPDLDSLRGDPRFEAMVALAAPKEPLQ